MPSNVLVSGIGIGGQNITSGDGVYEYAGALEQYDSWVLFVENEYYRITWGTDTGIGPAGWCIECASEGVLIANSEESVAHPWLVQTWTINESSGWPISNLQVTEVLDQPTFGLPADVVALITSRFGSVANYLRLRNQGQI